MRVTAGVFYKGQGSESEPKVGDMKIAFAVTRPRQVSVLAEQTQGNLRGFQGKSGTTIERLEDGNKSSKEMIAAAEAENTTMTWILRLVGFILMAVGIYMLVNPLVVFADVLPFLGNITGYVLGFFAALCAFALSFLTIGIAWIYYRPMIGIPLLVIAGLGFIGIIVMVVKGRRKAVVREAR